MANEERTPASTAKRRQALTGSGTGGVAGAAAIILAWISREFWKIEMPAEIVAGTAVLITWVAERIGGYMAARSMQDG